MFKKFKCFKELFKNNKRQYYHRNVIEMIDEDLPCALSCTEVRKSTEMDVTLVGVSN
jgi:hypothetical protein